PPLEYLHPPQPGDVEDCVHDLPAKKDWLIDMTAEVDDAHGMGAVFVAIRKVVDQVVRRREPGLFELLGAARSRTGQRADGRVGGDGHAAIVACGGESRKDLYEEERSGRMKFEG